jgi:hypothetical protein
VSELADRKAVASGEWKLIVDLEEGTESLYRVGPEAGIEGAPEAVPDPEVVGRLRRRLDAVLERAPEATVAPGPIDAETERRLRELGYLDEGAAGP